MSTPISGFKKFSRNLAAAGLVAWAMGFWTGCVLDPAAGKPAETDVTGSEMSTSTLENQTDAPVNGVPRGCSREWSATAHDSVVYCADIRPPKP